MGDQSRNDRLAWRSSAFLAGARSRRLVERLTADVETLGGRVTREAQDDAPSIVRIDGLRLPDLRDVAKSTGTHLGLRVEISVEPGPTIAALLPPLDSVLAGLRVVTLPTKVDTEVYNAATGRWMASGYPDGPGAYRFQTEPSMYVYATPSELSSGLGRLGDARLVKHLSAAQHHVSLIAYDPEARSLLAQLGARLPGLYERAAVLCSGCAPRREGGIVRYAGVPPTVATMLAERLGVA